MNSEQLTRAFFGVVVFIGMAAYPPWVSSSVETPTVYNNQPVLTSQLVTGSAGYSWLWAAPDNAKGARPDLIRLSIQWVAVIALFGLWIIASKNQPLQKLVTSPSKPDTPAGRTVSGSETPDADPQ